MYSLWFVAEKAPPEAADTQHYLPGDHAEPANDAVSYQISATNRENRCGTINAWKWMWVRYRSMPNGIKTGHVHAQMLSI